MKQITIYEFLEKNKDYMKDDYVAYDPEWGWSSYNKKPTFMTPGIGWNGGLCLEDVFNIKPFDGDWKDSLIKIEHKEEDTLLMVDKTTGPEWYKNGKRIK